jgi:hypothetical protein
MGIRVDTTLLLVSLFLHNKKQTCSSPKDFVGRQSLNPDQLKIAVAMGLLKEDGGEGKAGEVANSSGGQSMQWTSMDESTLAFRLHQLFTVGDYVVHSVDRQSTMYQVLGIQEHSVSLQKHCNGELAGGEIKVLPDEFLKKKSPYKKFTGKVQSIQAQYDRRKLSAASWCLDCCRVSVQVTNV